MSTQMTSKPLATGSCAAMKQGYQGRLLTVYRFTYYSQYHARRLDLCSEISESEARLHDVDSEVNYWLSVANALVPQERMDTISDSALSPKECLLNVAWPRATKIVNTTRENYSITAQLPYYCTYSGTLFTIPDAFNSWTVFGTRIKRLSLRKDVEEWNHAIGAGETDVSIQSNEPGNVAIAPQHQNAVHWDFSHMKNLSSLCLAGRKEIIFDNLTVLTKLEELNLCGCNQNTITDSTFIHLQGLKKLNMRGCNQYTITDSMIRPLTQLSELDISFCDQRQITDAAFRSMTALTKLSMEACTQTTITNEGFRYFSQLRYLDTQDCNQSTITDDIFRHLSHLSKLNIGWCTWVTNEAFSHLRNLRELHMEDCTQVEITDDAFRLLHNLIHLNISGCWQTTITDAAFNNHLANISTLEMRHCLQSTITSAAFQCLTALSCLDVSGCDQETISLEELRRLSEERGFKLDTVEW